jgi:hypothetical protein
MIYGQIISLYSTAIFVLLVWKLHDKWFLQWLSEQRSDSVIGSFLQYVQDVHSLSNAPSMDSEICRFFVCSSPCRINVWLNSSVQIIVDFNQIV